MRSAARAFVMFLTVCAAWPATAETLKFKFNEARDAKDWRATGAVWKVRDRAYGPTPTAEAKLSVSLLSAQIFNRTKKFGHITVKAPIAELDDRTGAGVLVRSTLRGRVLSGYLVNINNNGSSSDIRISRADGYNISDNTGNFQSLCIAEIVLAAKKNLRVTVEGGRIQAYLNGELKCSATDRTYPAGAVGLFGGTITGFEMGFISVGITFEK